MQFFHDLSSLFSWAKRHPEAVADMKETIAALRASLVTAPADARKLVAFARAFMPQPKLRVDPRIDAVVMPVEHDPDRPLPQEDGSSSTATVARPGCPNCGRVIGHTRDCPRRRRA